MARRVSSLLAGQSDVQLKVKRGQYVSNSSTLQSKPIEQANSCSEQ